MNIEKDIKHEEWIVFFKAVISALIRQYSRDKNIDLGQQDIAKKIGKDPAMISNIINGKQSVELTQKYFDLIIDAYNFEVLGFDLQNEKVEIAFKNKNIQKGVGDFYYMYYYLPQQTGRFFTIAKAMLHINKTRKEASLIFFKKGTNEIISTNTGEMYEAADQLAIFFHPQKKKQLDENNQYPSLIYLAGGWESLGNEYLSGTFSAYGPSCGLIVIHKQEQEEILKKVSKQGIENIPEPIVSMLRNNRIEPLERRGTTSFKDTISMRLIEAIKPFEGVYELFTLESRPSRESIHKLRLEIFGGCRIRIYSSFHENGKVPYEGYIVDIQNKTLSCFFTYRRHRGSFRNMMILSMNPPYQRFTSSDEAKHFAEKLFISIYAGMEGDNFPIGGRGLLRKASNENFQPSSIRLSDTKQIRQLFSEHPYLKPFLRGELDEFADSPALLEKYNLLRKSVSRNKDLKKFAGTFMNYRLYNDHDSIHVRPLKIYESGKVTIYNKDKKGNGPVYKGNAEFYGNNILSIFINKRNNKPYYFHMMFFVGGFPSVKKYCCGISTIFTSTGELRAGREILFFNNKNTDKIYYREHINFNVNGKIKNLEKRMPGICEYLKSKDNNFLTVSSNEKFGN